MVLVGVATFLFGQTGQLQQHSYTAEFKVTRERTLADGSRSVQELTEVRAQDAQRRVFISATTKPKDADSSSITQVIVVDPTAHNSTSWTVPGDEAVVTMLPTLDELSRRCASQAGGSDTSGTPKMASRPKNVDLGKETIMGLEARRSRETKTIFVPDSNGSSQVTRTREIWLAAGPVLIVKAVISDPGIEKFKQELVRFDAYEPYPTIFQPPEGYKIVTRPADQAPCTLTVEPELLTPPPW